MSEQPQISLANFDVFVAQALEKTRIVEAAITVDVIPNFKPIRRVAAEHIVKRLQRREIFDARMIVEVEVLIEQISRAILKGTTEIEMIDNDPCNVSPAVWRQSERSAEANDLARAEARRISEAACPANTDAAPSQRGDQ